MSLGEKVVAEVRAQEAGSACHDCCAHPTRARQILGWEPRVPLEDGLRRTLEASAQPAAKVAH
jgi:nucleoside-diphosphate-sugar epimerase